MLVMAVVGVHVLCGLVAVAAGVTAMLTRKGSRRHRRAGRTWLIGLGGLCVTAAVLGSWDWAHRWHLLALGTAAAIFASVGFMAARRRWVNRRAVHIVAMGGSFIAALTAFYVDNGPRLPLWNLLPPVTFWFLPALVGLPLMIRALRRHTQLQPRGRWRVAVRPHRRGP